MSRSISTETSSKVCRTDAVNASKAQPRSRAVPILVAALLALTLPAGCRGGATAMECSANEPTRPVVRLEVTESQVRVTTGDAEEVAEVATVSHASARRGVAVSTTVARQPTIVVIGPDTMSRVVLGGTTTVDATRCRGSDLSVATSTASAGATVEIEGFDAAGTRLFEQSIPVDDDRTGVVAPVAAGP